MRVNVASNGRARLVMRQRGNLGVLMNANLWPEMQVTKMEGGKVSWHCAALGSGAECCRPELLTVTMAGLYSCMLL